MVTKEGLGRLSWITRRIRLLGVTPTSGLIVSTDRQSLQIAAEFNEPTVCMFTLEASIVVGVMK
jgi:hypothetical protein